MMKKRLAEKSHPGAIAELLDESLSLELLGRARCRLHGSCVCYANAAQRAWGLDALLRELGIPS